MGNFSNAKAITFFDTETTHLDASKSAVLQISIITDWEDGTTDTWSTKIRPRDLELHYASPDALKICKYDDDEWEDAPFFEDVAETIAKKLRWGPIVAHNIQFDIAHLKASFVRRGWREPTRDERFDDKTKLFRFGYPVIDTCALAYLYLPTERQNLNAAREYLEISQDRAHDAITDTEDCRQLFYHIIGQTCK
jgi:DNA polymerase III subunit epsilon